VLGIFEIGFCKLFSWFTSNPIPDLSLGATRITGVNHLCWMKSDVC
jgi:hypothetical protein